jgi:hypothetical protein
MAGPAIGLGEIKQFLEFCATQGHATREHSSLTQRGYQVQHSEHWMGLCWNKNTKRYTADRRMAGLVASFQVRSTT